MYLSKNPPCLSWKGVHYLSMMFLQHIAFWRRHQLPYSGYSFLPHGSEREWRQCNLPIVYTIYMHTHNALRVNGCTFLVAWSSILVAQSFISRVAQSSISRRSIIHFSRRSVVHCSSLDRPFLSSLNCAFLVAWLSIVAWSSIDHWAKQDLVYCRLSVLATKRQRLNGSD